MDAEAWSELQERIDDEVARVLMLPRPFLGEPCSEHASCRQDLADPSWIPEDPA